MRPPSDNELRLLLLRLSRKLPERLKLLKPNSPRNIQLGLERIKRAVPPEQTWQGIHVAGTNGKGSICAYMSGLFTLTGKSHGRFTSPAFPEKRHGVVINGEVVRQSMYDHERDCVLRRYEKLLAGFQVTSGGKFPGHLTPFEIETATAFRIFNTVKVPYGIVEVGMGGGTDATNVMKNKGVTIISKIGIDHAEYLGRTLSKIALVKAGIMARKVPCIVDHTNEPEVLEVLEHHALETGSPLILSSEGQHLLATLDSKNWQLEDWQQQNLLCAVTAFNAMFPDVHLDLNKLMEMNPSLPGRLQRVQILPTHEGGNTITALVDGAHNPLATKKLSGYVDKNLRVGEEPVTWIIGFSHSDTKPFKEMLSHILRPQDSVAFVEFAQQEGDPPPVVARAGREWVRECLGQPTSEQLAPAGITLEESLEWARQKSGTKGPVVITGSLYLMRDLMNLPHVDGGQLKPETRNIGSATFRALRKKKREEGLTGEELLQYLAKKREYSDPRDRARLIRRNRKREEAIASGRSNENPSSEDAALIESAADMVSGRLTSSSVEKKTVMDNAEAEAFLATSESDEVAALEEILKNAARRPKSAIYTPFWRDPDNPSMSLPNPSGKLTRREANRIAWAKRKLQRIGDATGLEGIEEDGAEITEEERVALAAHEQPLVADEAVMIEAAQASRERRPKRHTLSVGSPSAPSAIKDMDAINEEELKKETEAEAASWSSILQSRKST